MFLSFTSTRAGISRTLVLELDIVWGELEICTVTENGTPAEFFPTRVEMDQIRRAFEVEGRQTAA